MKNVQMTPAFEKESNANAITISLVLLAIYNQIQVANGEPMVVGTTIDRNTGKKSDVYLALWIDPTDGVVNPIVEGFALLPEKMLSKLSLEGSFSDLVERYIQYLEGLMSAVKSGALDDFLHLLTERLGFSHDLRAA